MPRRIPTASQWQPTDILGQHQRLSAPFVRSLARCIRLHFQGKDPQRVRQAFKDARGAVVFLRVAIKDDAERPRQATVNRNLDTLAEALSDALAALSALDIRAREALYDAASADLSTTRQGLNLTPFKDEVVEIVDIDGVPTRVTSNPKRLRGRHAVRQFAAACSDATVWVAKARKEQPSQDRRSEQVPGLSDFAAEIALIWHQVTGQKFKSSPKMGSTRSIAFLADMLRVAEVPVTDSEFSRLISIAAATKITRAE